MKAAKSRSRWFSCPLRKDISVDEPLQIYWMALGKFVHRYSMVEATLFQVFRITAGLSNRKTKAVFSKMRVRELVSGIKNINESTGVSQSLWLERAFSKIEEITTIRDRILHDGFELKGDQVIVSNWHKTTPRKARVQSYTIADFDALEADCCTIVACLNVHWIEAKMPKKMAQILPREREIAMSPWRYEAPQPSKIK